MTRLACREKNIKYFLAKMRKSDKDLFTFRETEIRLLIRLCFDEAGDNNIQPDQGMVKP